MQWHDLEKEAMTYSVANWLKVRRRPRPWGRAGASAAQRAPCGSWFTPMCKDYPFTGEPRRQGRGLHAAAATGMRLCPGCRVSAQRWQDEIVCHFP